ncbi:phenylacetate--CoA ligase family protein [Leptospira brenneri]|uniref:Phenylacetate--CoA ligase family protein n=2 Tax=Leptospira brenneri TaxID=2023182 RepID=A0A2M9XZ34_9LEPT|nr:AMP-binding protein [Leptospira brenneri]PJZ44590.1 phenylacetate--CoA ligase [Leptospira brenneri]TGK97132.1 phenylacetate--CoA ligase family protein [Leptospira brenneri]
MLESWKLELDRLVKSRFAPIWNVSIGDRIEKEDFDFVKEFHLAFCQAKTNQMEFDRKAAIRFIRKNQYLSLFFKNQLNGLSPEDDFESIPFTTREDLQTKMTEIIPVMVDLNRMVINPTSGTTGQPILAPNHPKAIGCYVPLIEWTVGRYGVIPKHKPESTFAIQLCYQENTIVYATTHSLAGGAKFAKINLHQNSWKDSSDLENFIKESSPQILTGDPYALEAAMKMGLNYKPEAIHSTALELTDSLRKKLEQHFECPVINSYSLNETGPIAYACPKNPDWMHILPHDLYVEIISDKTGEVEPSGNVGEIVITGGRNPYLPLLRYKTGDRGELRYGPCHCGDNFPRLRLLSGRKPVYFTKPYGETVNPVDVARILRRNPHIYQFQMEQFTNKDFICRVSASHEFSKLTKQEEGTESTAQGNTLQIQLQLELESLLGFGSQVQIDTNFPLDGKKQPAFINSYAESKEKSQ